jgi:phosphohistidine phosphatase SixA
MRLILVRHGEKEPTSGLPEKDWPLKPLARKQAEALRAELERHGCVPGYCLASRYQHALDTAAILATGEESKKPVIGVTGLTPFTDENLLTLTAMLAEAAEQGIAIAEASIVAVVGHHPRVGKLAKQLTGTEPPQPAYLEALVLAESSLAALAEGKAWIERRCFGLGHNGVPRIPDR